MIGFSSRIVLTDMCSCVYLQSTSMRDMLKGALQKAFWQK